MQFVSFINLCVGHWPEPGMLNRANSRHDGPMAWVEPEAHRPGCLCGFRGAILVVPLGELGQSFLPWALGSLSGIQWLGSCLIPERPRIYSPRVGPLIFHLMAGETESQERSLTELPRLYRVLTGPCLWLRALTDSVCYVPSHTGLSGTSSAKRGSHSHTS